MICPTCGNNVSNDKSVCPLCGTELSETISIPRARGVWCKSCGALIPLDATLCPKCMTPTELGEKQAQQANVRKLNIPDIDTESDDILARSANRRMSNAEDIAQFESAIPSYSEIEQTSLDEGAPNVRTFFVALFSAILVLGAVFVVIARPWDPNYDIRAQVEADLSNVGSMEQIEHLQGQDVKERDATSTVFTQIQNSYDELAALKGRLDENEKAYAELCIEGSKEQREDAAHDAEILAIELSNLIAEVGQIGGSSSEYSEQVEHIITLGNWLRNRVDSLRGAWSYDLSFDNPADSYDEITNYLTNTGSYEYIRLFEQNYDTWAPHE